MSDEQLRRNWIMPPADVLFGELDFSLLDPNDEDERRILIEAEHPDLRDALEAGADEVTIGGRTFSPRMHIAMHEVVATQIWDDNPPEMLATAQRLAAQGYDRHDVLHLLANVVSRDIFHALRGELTSRERTVRALQRLPDIVNDDEPFAGNRAARRAAHWRGH